MQQVILVSVGDPKQIKTTFSSYFQFTIKYKDKYSQSQCYKRYSDFDHLKNSISDRWPCIHIPALPPKKVLGVDQKFVVERCCGLNQFCVQISKRPHLWYGQQFQCFLKENQVQKKLALMPRLNYYQISQKYKNQFMYSNGKNLGTAQLAKISSFSAFIKKVNKIMQIYKQTSQFMTSLNAVAQKDQFIVYNSLIPDFQACVVGKLGSDNIISENQKLRQLLTQYQKLINSDQFKMFQKQLNSESIQIQNFIQTLKSRESLMKKRQELQIKIKSVNTDIVKSKQGKSAGFFPFFKSNPQQQRRKAEVVLQITQRQEKAVQQILGIATIILAHYEIQNFRQQRQKKYYQMLKRIGQAQKKRQECKHQIFTLLLDHHALA